MIRKFLIGAAALGALTLSTSAFAQAQFGTAAEAKAMLDKAVVSIKADKAKALADMQKGEGGFKDRDLYAFCANASDGAFTAHPALMGKNIRDIKDKDGKALGEEMMKVAAEGKVEEVSYMWPRPGADTTPVAKVSYVTKAGDQVCGVGYYK
jgi:signal transduction histidine kinase